MSRTVLAAYLHPLVNEPAASTTGRGNCRKTPAVQGPFIWDTRCCSRSGVFSSAMHWFHSIPRLKIGIPASKNGVENADDPRKREKYVGNWTKKR